MTGSVMMNGPQSPQSMMEVATATGFPAGTNNSMRRLIGLRRGLMLGGSMFAASLFASGYAGAQTTDDTDRFSPTKNISNVGSTDNPVFALTDADASNQLNVGAVDDRIALTGKTNAQGVTPVTSTGTTRINLFGSTIAGGTSSTTPNPGGNAISLTSGMLTLDLSDGGAINAGAGATPAPGADAIIISSGSTLNIIGAAEGDAAATISGANALGGNDLIGAAIDTKGKVSFTEGLTILRAGAFTADSNKGGAVTLGEGASIYIAEGATVRVGTEAGAAGFNAGFRIEKQLTAADKKTSIAGGEYKLLSFSNQGTIERTSSGGYAILIDDDGTADASADSTLAAGTALHLGSIIDNDKTAAVGNALVGILEASTTKDHGEGSAVIFSGDVKTSASTATSRTVLGINNTENVTVIFDGANVVAGQLLDTAPTIASGGAPTVSDDVTIRINNSKITISDILDSAGLTGNLNLSIIGDSQLVAPVGAATTIIQAATTAAANVNITPGAGNNVVIDFSKVDADSVLVTGSASSSLEFGEGTTEIRLAGATVGRTLTLASATLDTDLVVAGNVNIVDVGDVPQDHAVTVGFGTGLAA